MVTVIQYVTAVALARCTATDQSISGTLPVEVGIMYHTTFHAGFQLNVNHRWLAFAGTEPVN